MRKILLLLSILSLKIAGAQTSQVIRGVVTDRSGGTPMEYVTVAIQGSNPFRGAMTDSLGRFRIEGISVGRYTVAVSCVGYMPVELREVLVTSAKETVLDIQMQEDLRTLGEVTVRPKVNKGEPLNSMSIAGGRLLSVEEASRFAGGMDDPARLASAFAGVASNVGNNGIVVRGNAPKSLGWRIEEVEIPNPNHFAEVTSFGGGGFTSLSAQVLANSDFFTGAFPAEYDNALSGVFDMKMRSGNASSHEHTLGVSALGIDVASEGPFSKNYNGSYIFNYRYSTLSLLSPLLPEDADGTKYQDLSFKFNLPTRHVGTFSLWGTGLIDRSGTDAETAPAKWVYDQDREDQDVKQYMGAIGLSHRIQAGRDAFVKSTLAATVSGLDMHTERASLTSPSISSTGGGSIYMIPQNVVKNTNWNFVFATAYQKKFSRWHTNKTGIRIKGMRYDLKMQNRTNGTLQTLNDESGTSALLSAYTSSKLQFSEKWTVTVGLNASFFALNHHYAIEPRASLRRQLSSSQSVYFSYGLHGRLEMLSYYFTRDKNGQLINKDLDFTRAHHFSLGYDLGIGNHHHLRVEPYVQLLYDVPVIRDSTFSLLNAQGGDDMFFSDRLTNDGRGLNYGIDLTLEQYMHRGFYYLLTASLFNSRYKTNLNKWYDTRYNRHFVLNLLAGKEWQTGRTRRNTLGISGRITLQGGDRYSPINESASSVAHDAIYDETRPYTCHFSPSFITHLTATYRLNRRTVSHEFFFKMVNLTGFKDYYGHRYNWQTGGVEPEREATFAPNVGYKIQF